jgi:limonene-1,2-epoxide hydrolase
VIRKSVAPVNCRNKPVLVWLLGLLMGISTAWAGTTEAFDEAAEVQATRDVIKAYERQDWNAVADMFAEDGMLHSVMRDPFVGREVIRQRLVDFHVGMESLDLQIIHIGKVDNVVMVERLDNWHQGGKDRSLPAVGVLQFENGLIKVWREYYDLESLKKQMAP